MPKQWLVLEIDNPLPIEIDETPTPWGIYHSFGDALAWWGWWEAESMISYKVYTDEPKPAPTPNPTPDPTPTPTPETWQENTYIVQVEGLNIRAEANTSAVSRGKLPKGRQVRAAVRTPALVKDGYEWAKVTDMNYPVGIGYIAIHVYVGSAPAAPILAKPSTTGG